MTTKIWILITLVSATDNVPVNTEMNIKAYDAMERCLVQAKKFHSENRENFKYVRAECIERVVDEELN